MSKSRFCMNLSKGDKTGLGGLVAQKNPKIVSSEEMNYCKWPPWEFQVQQTANGFQVFDDLLFAICVLTEACHAKPAT